MSAPNANVRPTPSDLNPPDTVCLQIEIPNDRQWIAAFYDAVEQLSYWYAWDRDDAHTGREVAARWWRAFLTIRKCREAAPKDGCCDGSEETLIRQNPDNPCLLESSSDGIHWCTLFDQSLCTPENGQPGSGARQPLPGGGEECYHADFPATMQWNLPTVVSAGDTIEVKNTGGQATDAPNHVWYCPNGQLFFAGKCISTPFTQGGDPAAAANHMTIVCQISGVWYSCDSPITVPGGVSSAPVVFQVNDGTLSDNSGGYNFDVCVTNNGVGTWESTLDFTLDPYSSIKTGGLGTWVAGTGYQGQSNGFQPYVIQPYFDFSAAELTGYEIHYNCSAHSGTSDGSGIYVVATSSGYLDGITALVNGTNVIRTGAGDKPGATEVQPTLNSGATGSQVTMTKLILRGKGTKPPQLP